tara:strand:+ start:1033 stop:2256 length:1224 start_codon:yes stop_codon:yes gene_type:complete
MLKHLIGHTPGTDSDLVKWTLDTVRKHLGMDVAYISEFVDDQSVLRHVDAPGLEEMIKPGDAHSLDDVYCRHILEGRLPELMPDTSLEPVAAAMPVTAMIGSHVSVPLRRPNGDTYGMFCCFGSAPNPSLNERDLGITRAFANLVAEQIGREFDRNKEVAEKKGLIRNLIAKQDFSLVYQPIVDLYTNRPAGFECLTRFDAQPSRTPDIWFNEAADVGLGTDLELTVLRHMLATMLHFPDEMSISINAGPETLQHADFAGLFAGLPFDRIVLEVTEHARIADYDALSQALRPLREKGMKLAVDDAGAGYSSLHHVLKLRPDIIKLDMSLTKNVDTDPAKRSLAAAMLLFARQTGSVIVAEGIEKKSELEALKALGISRGQGYLLSRPLVLADALRFAGGGAASRASA